MGSRQMEGWQEVVGSNWKEVALEVVGWMLEVGCGRLLVAVRRSWNALGSQLLEAGNIAGIGATRLTTRWAPISTSTGAPRCAAQPAKWPPVSGDFQTWCSLQWHKSTRL